MTIRFIEELSFNMLPSLRTVYYDGWLLRLSDEYTRRGNSVQALYPSTLPLDEKIAHCETVYTAAKQRTIFKLTDAAQPADLDAALAGRGYEREAESLVMTTALSGQTFRAEPSARTLAEPTNAWFAVFCRLLGLDTRHQPTMRLMLDRIVPQAAFATVYAEGQVAAVGAGLLERGYIGLIDIVVEPSLRGQGWGTRLLHHLLAWGQMHGATHAYLQVQGDNEAAVRLYTKLGFSEAYRYWYRVRDLR